jgi:SAM-dependent methyltransferase
MSTDAENKRLVNLGCGSRYHPAWINIDIAPHNPGVIKHDLVKNIPLESSSCDVVYHSAFLEHIRPSDTKVFLCECKRVLKPGGILRVGVPDLEALCKIYLETLQSALNGDESAFHDYDWLLLELCDQSVRERSGGEMLAYLKQNPMPNEKFVFDRIGEEGRNLVNALRHSCGAQRIIGLSRQLVVKFRLMLLKCLLGADGIKALEIGRFRLSGEVHQWVYDRYSLSRLLLAVDFCEPVRMTASTSQIPNWSSFNLDTLSDGTVIKPDLFYMEAIKS